VRELWNAARDDWTAVQKMQYVDLCTALPDNLLVKVDRMLMAHGVEGRVPLLDHRVVELGLALSDKLKIHGGSGKWLVRKWAATRLPAEVCTRRKSGFHVPVGSWLRGPLLGRVAASLAESPVIRHWFHDRGVRQLVAEQDRNGSVTRPLWTLLQLALWHRIFVENDARRPPAEGDPLALLG
jgi:asparagine synthase (glutamine-hydrolysing)